MIVVYSRAEIPRTSGKGEQRVDYNQTRIRVSCPFEVKDALKSTGFAAWYKKGRFWNIPATSLSLNECARSVKRSHPNVRQQLGDDFVRHLATQPTSVEDVEIRDLPRAVIKPWDHQRVGAHLVGQLSGVMLAYDMGCGKTKAVLDAVVEYDMRRVFVVCPPNVVDVWASEARKHLPRDFGRIVLELGGRYTCAERRDMIRDALAVCDESGGCLICVINYEAIASPHGRIIRELVASHDWDLVVADECHRAANWTTRISKFLAGRMVHKARHRVGLSGTPLGNGPQDAYGQFLFIDPGLYGEFVTRFRARYLIMGGFENKQVLDFQNEQEFRDRMSRLTVVVKLRDVLDLPPERDEERKIQLTPATLRVYRELREEFIADWKGGVILGDNVLTRLVRLAQITSGFSKVRDEETGEDVLVEIGTEKTDAVTELLRDIAPAEPVVVFCRFVHDLHEVKRAALLVEPERPSYMLGDGRHQIREWEESCDRGEGAVFAVQLKAGGVGIDLTRACYGIYYSIGFEPIDYRQSRARIMRPGQTRPVIYYHLIAPGTVDRMIYRAQGKKRAVVDSVIDELVNAKELVT